MDIFVILLILLFGLALIYAVVVGCKKVCSRFQNDDTTIEDSLPMQFSTLPNDEDIVDSASGFLRGGIYSEGIVPSRPIRIPPGRRQVPLKTYSERNARKARALSLVRDNDEPPPAYEDLSTAS